MNAMLAVNAHIVTAILTENEILYSGSRKWGTQQAATLHFQLLAQNCMDRWFWNMQSLSKLSNSNVMIFSKYSCNCIHHLFWAKSQWLYDIGEQRSGSFAFGEGLMPMKDCRISKLFLISACFSHQLRSLCCRFL